MKVAECGSQSKEGKQKAFDSNLFNKIVRSSPSLSLSLSLSLSHTHTHTHTHTYKTCILIIRTHESAFGEVKKANVTQHPIKWNSLV